VIRMNKLQIRRAQEQTALWLAGVDPGGGLAALVDEARAHNGYLDEHDYQSLIQRALGANRVAVLAFDGTPSTYDALAALLGGAP
jgi:hypothetical protein